MCNEVRKLVVLCVVAIAPWSDTAVAIVERNGSQAAAAQRRVTTTLQPATPAQPKQDTCAHHYGEHKEDESNGARVTGKRRDGKNVPAVRI